MIRRAWVLALIVVAAGLGPARAFAADPPEAAPAGASASAPATAASAPLAPATAASAPASILSAPAAPRASDANERLQIADPYIELRTGPGRGFPIYYVASRGEWIEVEQRHTDWFEVRTDGGKAGWVNRSQLETTLTAAGITKSFRDVLVDDYLNRKVQLGAAWGHFKAEPMLKLWSSYRLSETLSLEGTIGQVQGVFSGTDFWHLNVLAEPWSDRRISPFFSIGVGKFTNFPNLSLVGATTTNAKLANASLGVRYYLTDRFVMRADYSLYTVFVNDAKTTEYRAWTAGLAFFF
jgi:Bacterial SH3 domain